MNDMNAKDIENAVRQYDRYDAPAPSPEDLSGLAKVQRAKYDFGQQLSSFTELRQSPNPRQLFAGNQEAVKAE